VSSDILRKFLQWAAVHKDDPEPNKEDDDNKDKRTDDIIKFDTDFVNVDKATLYELILAANYLGAKDLMALTCKAVAEMCKDKSTEEMREMFNIPNNFSP